MPAAPAEGRQLELFMLGSPGNWSRGRLCGASCICTGPCRACCGSSLAPTSTCAQLSTVATPSAGVPHSHCKAPKAGWLARCPNAYSKQTSRHLCRQVLAQKGPFQVTHIRQCSSSLQSSLSVPAQQGLACSSSARTTCGRTEVCLASRGCAGLSMYSSACAPKRTICTSAQGHGATATLHQSALCTGSAEPKMPAA